MNNGKKEIYEELDNYFSQSEKEFWIGVQNFQGIREYTKIPLAPLTLLYGQNSAGKSTIHDAQQFIYGYFSGEWGDEKIAKHLDRWANNRRISDPLTKGYLGNFDDVVFSISSAANLSDHAKWESTLHQNQNYDEGIPYFIFGSNCGCEDAVPFKIDIYFSHDIGEWYVRQYSLFLGGELCAELIFDDFENSEGTIDEYVLFKLNKQHFVYSYIDSCFEYELEQVIKSTFVYEFEQAIISSTEKITLSDEWFSYHDMDIENRLNIQNLVGWSDVDSSPDIQPTPEMLMFRTVILSFLQVPAHAVARSFDFNSIPPLRPIPSSEGAVFRRHSNSDNKLSDWSLLAEQVCLKLIKDSYPIECNDENSPDKYQLDEINRILSHPLFLNTDFEVTGECQFLTSIDVLMGGGKSNEEMRNLLMKLDAEIHLKLRHKSLGWLTEIEDVGVGISQIIPVLVAISKPHSSFRSDKYSVFIQQPELHLHPKLQAQLADAFIECVNDRMASFSASPCFIVESHSEHFLLRLLRRIRETSNSDIKNKLFSLHPDNVSVLYVDKLEDGSSKIFPLRISADGDFIDRWPNGFFTERDGELFDE